MTDFNVIYNIIAQDKFSNVGKKFASVANNIKRKVGTMSNALNKSRATFKKLNATVGKTGRSFRQFGKTMTTSVSLPAAAFAGNAIRLFDKQAQAVTKVKTLIESTGGSAKLTFKELNAEAQRLQQNTIFGDEEILNSVTAQLLTFTNIAGDNFMKTQKAVLDLSTVLDGDLQSASIQLGKALNDPVANLSALSRSGIQFTQSQKDVIKSLSEGGRLADAQALILNELNKQYGGTAEAAAKAGAGPLKQLNNILGDLSETIGKEVLTIIKPLIAKIKELALKFNSASPMIKKAIAILALVLTVVGPLIAVLGTLIAMLPFMAAGWAMVSAAMAPILIPIIAIIAALTAALWVGNKISEWLQDSPALWFAIGAAVNAIINPIDTVVDLFDKIMSFDFSGVLNDVRSFFGFGDKAAEINAKAKSESRVDVNLNAPSGVVKSIKSRSSGNANLNVGTNMTATAQ